MTGVHELSRQDARRIALRAQALTAERPADFLDVVRRLGVVQLDPTKAIAPSADLVAWSRLGSAYSPAELEDALAEQTVIDHRGLLRPAEDMALHRAEMTAWPGRHELKDWEHGLVDWVRANDACRRDILELLRADGPLPQPEIPDTCVRPWRSTGWTNGKNVGRLLDQMVQRGEVAVAGRRGRDRLWDLAERVYPDEIVEYDDAVRLRNERRLSTQGLARPKAALVQGEQVSVGDAGEPAVVEGVRGEWRVDPAQLGQPFEGRTALLSPLDRLLHDRKRMGELFEFDYILEMYKPAAARQWGYYALPVLHGDRLVGKLDAHADHDDGVLRIHALHWDVEPFAAMTSAVEEEIDDLARWLGLETMFET